MIKDMHIEGYEKFCLHLDRLAFLAREHKVLTTKTLSKVYNNCNDKQGNEKHNLDNAIIKETCIFGQTLMVALGKNKLTLEDIKKCQQNQKYLYKVFFKPDYEPLVEEIEK